MHTFSTECLDHLLGEKLDKFRSLPPYNSAALLSRVAPVYSTTSALLQPPRLSTRRPQHAHIQPQQSCHHPPATAHPGNSFALYSPCAQPTAPGSLNSPMAGKMPPVYNAALQAEYSVGPRSMQDFLLEGEAGYDIDMLNPSLTDLQLQGKKVIKRLIMGRKRTSGHHCGDFNEKSGCTLYSAKRSNNCNIQLTRFLLIGIVDIREN